MNAVVKFATILAVSCIIGLVAIPASAQDAGLQRIAADGSTALLGRPVSASPQMALTGKALTLVWESGTDVGEMSEVRVDRITDTRRIEVVSENINKIGKRWTWNWTPPKTRAVVHYEVRLAALPEEPIILEVHDAERMAELRSGVPTMKWEAFGLTEAELKALELAGIHGIKNESKQNSQSARLRITHLQETKQRRELTWDAENHHMVVWKPGPAAGDLMIRAPRWWISSEALSTDHGVIRLYKLLFEPSVAP